MFVAGACRPDRTEYLATAVTQFMTTVLTHPGNQIRFAAGSPQHTQLVLVLQGIYNLTHCRWLPVVVKIEVETCIKAFFDMFRERKLGTRAAGGVARHRRASAHTASIGGARRRWTLGDAVIGLGLDSDIPAYLSKRQVTNKAINQFLENVRNKKRSVQKRRSIAADQEARGVLG